MDYQTRIYKQAMKLYERMSPEQQKEEEDALIAEGHTSDEDKTMAFVEKFTNPELFQAAITKARPNTLQEVGGALSAGLGAYGAGLAGRDPTAAGADIYDRFRDVADRPVKNLEDDQKRIQEWIATNMKVGKATAEERRAQGGEDRTSTVYDQSQEAVERKTDIESDISNMARDLATKNGIPVREGANATEVIEMIELAAKANKLSKKDSDALALLRYELSVKKEDRMDRQAQESKKFREDKESQRQTEHGEGVVRAENKQSRKEQAELAKRLQDPLMTLKTIAQVEEQIAKVMPGGEFTLEQYVELDAQGRAPDVPGFNFAEYGKNITQTTQEGRRVAHALQRFKNQVIKDRSGAAVTVPEYERLQKEFGADGFATESDMWVAVARAKASIQYATELIRQGMPAAAINLRLAERDKGGVVPSDDEGFSDEQMSIYDKYK